MPRRTTNTRSAGGARPPSTEQALRIVQPIGLDIGPHQCELDQVMLRSAAADAFVLPRQRRQRVDCGGEIAALERNEAARQRWEIRAGRVTSLARQSLHLAGPRSNLGIITDDRLGQTDV